MPSEILAELVALDGTLEAEFDEVILTFSDDALSELGTGYDIELVVIPTLLEDVEFSVAGLSGDAKVYDIYMLINGKRITRTLTNGVGVSVDYELKDGQTVDRLHVYYVDVEPYEEYRFTYDGEKVTFTVYHFSHYAVSYESESKSGDNIVLIAAGIGIILLIVLLLLILLVLGRKKIRLDLDGGTYVFVPEGWKSESSSVIYRRFKKGDELIIPKVDARMGGATVTGWHPDPPKEVEKSETFKAVWSNQNDL